jgi:hypothetical protein
MSTTVFIQNDWWVTVGESGKQGNASHKHNGRTDSTKKEESRRVVNCAVVFFLAVILLCAVGPYLYTWMFQLESASAPTASPIPELVGTNPVFFYGKYKAFLVIPP